MNSRSIGVRCSRPMDTRLSKVIIASQHEELRLSDDLLEECIAGRQLRLKLKNTVEARIDFSCKRRLSVVKGGDDIAKSNVADDADVDVAMRVLGSTRE